MRYRLFAMALVPMCLGACQTMVPGNVVASRQQVAVGSDPRIELLSVIQLLSRYFLVTGHDIAYKAEVQTRFGPFADHRAVTLFREMARGDFRFNSVPDAIMRFGNPPALAQRLPPTPELAEAAGGEARLQEWVAALRDFAQASRFNDFYREHQPYYQQLAAAARPSVQPVVRDLNAYTGMPLSNATVVLGPLLHDGGFAAHYEFPDGRREAYAFVGPVAASAGIPDFGSAERMESLVAHEFAHLVINPTTERLAPEVNRYSHRLPAMAEAMRRRGYGGWNSVVNEHIIRAITVRLAALSRGEAAGQQALRQEVEWGFAYVPALVERLKVYEANRARYRTIADFYPELLTAFAAAPPAPPS